MGRLAPGTPPDVLLSREIVITQEVRELAQDWRKAGVLTFGISDKPDEASVPSPELSAEGYLPLHQVEMAVVGT